MIPVKDKGGESSVGQGEIQTIVQVWQCHPNGELWSPTLGSNGQALGSLLAQALAGVAWEEHGLGSKGDEDRQGATAGGYQLTALLPPEGRPSAPSTAATGVYCVPGPVSLHLDGCSFRPRAT